MALIALCVIVAPGAFVYWSLHVPENSPMAKMYRTEAGLAALGRAIEAYRLTYGADPPEGIEGLEKSIEVLSRTARYFPDGPPHDGWGREFVYTPGLKGGFIQLFSMGQDGETGEGAIADDIQHTHPPRPWRKVYKGRQKAYLNSNGEE